MKEEICCPKFEPITWDEKMFKWKNKKFVKDKVVTCFYIPVNFGGTMKKLDKMIKKANASVPDWLCLSDHVSKWKMDVFLAVDKNIPGANNITLSGKFFSKVYEGPFKETKKWQDNFEALTKSKNLKVKKQYMWYTTCPKCVKKYGNNYVVIIAEIE